ncbi:MAG: rhodanese-like domain-containing protein [Tannerella sp.]|jgi:rhodanese-related sulfurtransferase|nr:rhodanese-like domain-containing protein [Tannerella sp.]
MKKLVYLASAAALLFSCKTQIGREATLRDIARRETTLIIDVRTPEEYLSGHVEKSVNIPLDVIAESTSQFESGMYMIVVCRSGKRSAQAKKTLEEKGFAHVYDGGGWEAFDKLIKK